MVKWNVNDCMFVKKYTSTNKNLTLVPLNEASDVAGKLRVTPA